MPRKKKETTAEAKPKAKATKKSTKKIAASTEYLIEERPQFVVTEMLEWTDEECKAKDKEIKFYVADVRNILKSVVDINEKLADITRKFNLLKDVLAKGLMTGYKIICPHCKRSYMVSSTELNRTSPIMCKICGTEYKEDENIDGVALSTDDDTIEVI